MKQASDERPPKRVGLYLRISKYDGEADRSPGTLRQEKDCRAEARRRGWQVVEPVYLEDDTSAFHGKRPVYQRMLQDLKAGLIDAVLAWHEDRLLRSNAELEDLVVLVEATGATIATVCAGDVDLETPEGRFKARILAAVARKESEDKSRRLRRMHKEKRDLGEWSGGTRPFGYGPDGVTPDPDEAPIVFEMVSRIAAGESLTGVTADLNARGVPTATGSRWTAANLRRTVMRPRYIGHVTHDGQDMGVKAAWPALVDETTWRRAMYVLTSPDRPQRRATRRYLLSGGLLVCGRCGHVMASKPRQRSTGESIPGYSCPPKALGGCHGVSIPAEEVEELISDEVIRKVESAAFAKALRSRKGVDRDALKTIASIEAERDELAAALGAGAISMREFKIARAAQDARLAAASTQVVTDQTTAAAGRYAGRAGVLRADWSNPNMTLDRKQAIIRSVIHHVVVDPATRGTNTFDPARVRTPKWRV